VQITIFKQAGKYRNFFNQISAVEKKFSLWHAFCNKKIYFIDIQQIVARHQPHPLKGDIFQIN